MKTLKVSLSISGIEQLQRELEEYSKRIREDTHAVAKAIAEDGAEVVRQRYDQAQSDYGSIHEHSIDVVEEQSKTRLVANGKHVAFYEYGTGINAGEGYPRDYVVDGIHVYPGSWSQSELGSKQFDFVNHPWWTYRDNEYLGIPPSFGMYEATKTARKNIDKHAKRIFGND